MKFRGMHEELTNEILRECKKIDFDKALQFLTMPFADLMDSYGNGASLIGRIIGRVAVTKLLKELGETNKPAWVVVISYNLGNLESPHDNHLCYGTSKDLKQQFDELSKRMFLLSSIPCGQNHAYLKQIENSESDREHLKKEILDHHENHQQEEIQTPSIQIRWSRKGYSDSECNDSETNNSITIRATGSLSEDESEGDFEYQIISNSSWSSYFEKILQLCHHNDELKSMLRTSIHSFLNKYPYNSSVDREELICSFFPGNVYKGDFNPFVKDGVIICFNNFSSVDDLTLEMIQQWTKEVTSSLDTVIAQLISKPTPPRNIRANGHDLRQFIDRFKAKNSDEDIYSDDSHSPGDIENIGNDIETEKQLLIQQRYPKYLNSLKSYLDRINSCASLKYKLYGMAFIGRRHTCNAVYLLDMIALSNEAGWSIDFPIADQQNLYQCYVNKLFSFYSEHELILVLEELILKTPNKKNHAIQRLSIGEDKLTWTLDLTVNLSSRNNNGLLKAIYLDYTTKRAINKDAHLLHRIIRAVELLSDLTICVYVYWNDAFDNNIRTRELLSFDSPPEDIIANLGLMGISNRAPGVRDRCLMILANKKVRFIVTREWSIT